MLESISWPEAEGDQGYMGKYRNIIPGPILGGKGLGGWSPSYIYYKWTILQYNDSDIMSLGILCAYGSKVWNDERELPVYFLYRI